MLRRYGLAFLCSVLFITVLGAGTKEEIIQLQTDVVQLQTKIIDLQKNLDANTKALRDLLIQIKDDVGATSAAVKDVRKQLASQQGEMDVSVSDLSKKIGTLSTQLDETNQRITALADQVSKMRLREEQPTALTPDAQNVPPADKLWETAYKDILQGNFEMALSEFQQFVRYYGKTERAAEAQYYIGDALFGLKRFGEAIKAFDEVGRNYPTAPVNAPALFKAGQAFMELGNREEAITRFRAVVEKFPDAPEASLSKKRLELLGVNIRSTPGRAKPTSERPVKRRS